MKVGSIGYNYIHQAPYCEQHEKGIGCGLLLLVRSKAEFTIAGEKSITNGNSFVILGPDVPVRYESREDRFINDWMFFSWNDEVEQELLEYHLPMNRVIPLHQMDSASAVFRQLCFEHCGNAHPDEVVEELYLRILLRKLSSGMVLETKANLSGSKAEQMIIIRARIYQMPEELLPVSTYAEWIKMSLSGFQHLYKKTFGVSVMEDIQKSRFDYAKNLLRGTNMSIREISERLGYTSEYSFMRQFKRFTGETAGQCRSII